MDYGEVGRHKWKEEKEEMREACRCTRSKADQEEKKSLEEAGRVALAGFLGE